MKIYGIKNCDKVRKALKYLKQNNIDYTFIDLKKEKVDENKIKEWIKKVDIDKLLNTKGTSYKNLKLKDLNLDENGKISWLVKENILLKRPVIEHKNQILVGFDENIYNEVFK